MKLHRVLGITLIAFVFAVASLSSPAARATSFSTDQSDVWSVPAEPGWAIQLVQRGSAIFATMYVYGPSSQATFYTATLEATAVSYTWTGDLIATTGPWFGAVPFNPALVTIQKVGTMTWNSTSVDSGTLTYTVNGVVVVKSLVRYLARYDNYNGTYYVNVHIDTTGCFNPANNSTSENIGALSVVQSGLNLGLVLAGSGGSCTYTGTFAQGGQFGQMTGTYTCTDGAVGTFVFFEMNVGVNYLTGRFSQTATSNGCQSTGFFAGIRHST
jgi:hypothetical protein